MVHFKALFAIINPSIDASQNNLTQKTIEITFGIPYKKYTYNFQAHCRLKWALINIQIKIYIKHKDGCIISKNV